MYLRFRHRLAYPMMYRLMPKSISIFRHTLACALILASGGAPPASAQASLPAYTDAFVNGFDDWSWALHDSANLAPIHDGARSISVSAAAWEGISFHHADMDTSAYRDFSFWAHGGTNGGQRLQVYAELSGVEQPAFVLPTPLTANRWQQFTIPLSTLGVANKPNLSRLNIQLRPDGTTGTFYLDSVQLGANPPPVLVNVSVNATPALRTVDARHFGVNLAIWDGYYDSPNDATTASLLNEMGCLAVRLPGGSTSDEYHWASNTSWTNTWQWPTSFPDFMRVATNIGAQVFVTVNYGSGSPQEAAAWVAYANGDAALYGSVNDPALGFDPGGRDWRTVGYWARLRTLTPASNPDHQFDFLALGRSAPLGIKNWEIGNECYGTWERDTNTSPNHAYTYAVRATNFMARMRAVDPSIKVGVVGVPGENTYANGYTDHPTVNPRTAQTNLGWTPILLTTLKQLGTSPDFLVHHVYPQWTDALSPATSPDNDTTLLQSSANWENDAADLRQQIADYFGPAGTNIELVCTENNSDSGAQGKQSTSLVNGLYYADSLSQLLKTEFKGFVWWDLRNSTDRGGAFASSLFGWRDYGDLGMINGLNTRHPSFYAAKLMQWFARPGDKILNATSDYAWLAVYAARRANGAISVLVLNKANTTNQNAQIVLNGFTPNAAATVRSFGISNDEATRTNGPAAAQDISVNGIAYAGTNFAHSFPPYSMSLLTLAPAAPRLATIQPTPAAQFVFQLQGQPEVRYVIQSSNSLTNWVSVSTNTLVTGTLNITNTMAANSAQKYWRAVWQP